MTVVNEGAELILLLDLPLTKRVSILRISL